MDFTPQFGMGSLPPRTDVRDYKVASAINAAELPISYSVPLYMSVKNQGGVNSCVAHALSSILEYHDKGENVLSTNFIYGGQYSICGRNGSGMYLRDACKIANHYGDTLETDCPGNTEVSDCYDIADEALTNEAAMEVAERFKIKSYATVKSDTDIKYAIMNYGPVLASVKWFYDTHVDDEGIMQTKHEGDFGYHAIVLYGWNEKGFLMQNSWGRGWGNQGRAILPYSYGIREAKAVVDADNDDIIVPRRNTFLDFIYKIINFFANLFPSR